MHTLLRTLAAHFGTDKGSVGPTTDWGGHVYTDIYECLFHSYRDKRINILEIGLGITPEIQSGTNISGGASIRMWNDYFQNANIFGIDIHPFTDDFSPRVKTMAVDQGDPEQLIQMVSTFGVDRFDIIIDDGSHLAHHQQISLETLLPFLPPGGIYVIEDLNNVDIQGATPAKNIRAVLKSFIESGEFGKPNVFRDTSMVSDQIDHISFHHPAPQITLRDFIVSTLRQYGLHKAVDERRYNYFPDSDKLAVIWKKA